MGAAEGVEGAYFVVTREKCHVRSSDGADKVDESNRMGR